MEEASSYSDLTTPVLDQENNLAHQSGLREQPQDFRQESVDIYRSGNAQVIGSSGSIVEVRSIKSSIQIQGGPDQGAIATTGFTNTIQWLHQQKIKGQNYSSYCQNTASSTPPGFLPTQAKPGPPVTADYIRPSPAFKRVLSFKYRLKLYLQTASLPGWESFLHTTLKLPLIGFHFMQLF